MDGDGSTGLLALYAVIALGFSFLCSIAEAVLLSVTPSYIATLREQGKRSAPLLERSKENIDRSLAAILSLNTIAHTLGAVGVGAEAAIIWGSAAVGLVSAAMTFLILVLSEIIPKTIGAVHWRSLAPVTARFVLMLIRLLLPLVWLSELLTRMIAGRKEKELVTREEVAAVAGLSSETGEMNAEEAQVLRNILRMDSLTVHDIMTPRTVIVAFHQDMTVGELIEQKPNLPVSRLPIHDGSIDRITGFVLKSDVLLAHASDNRNARLKEFRRPLKAIHDTASLRELFELLLKQREFLALVVDEYGGTDGIVTMEDLIETLLGIEIVDEADAAPDMQRLARRQWEHRVKALGLAMPSTNSGRNKDRTDG